MVRGGVYSLSGCNSGFGDSISVQTKERVGVHPNYKNHSQEVHLEAHDSSDNIIVEITNNSDGSIDELEYVVVCYQGNQIVSVSFVRSVTEVSQRIE